MTRNDALLMQLRTYEPCDPVEAEHLRRMVTLLEAPDAFSRGHFSPGHFTASCYIIDAAARLLLHHHRRLDRWLQMGGHIEADEPPHVAALREGAEESGLDDLELVVDGILDLDIHPIPAGKGEPDHEHFDVRYLATTRSADTIRMDEGESKELAWIPLDRAILLMHGAESARVIRKIERVLRERSES